MKYNIGNVIHDIETRSIEEYFSEFKTKNEITIPEGTLVLPSYCLSSIKASKLNLPKSLKRIERLAVTVDNLSDRVRIEINIPKDIQYMDKKAFSLPQEWAGYNSNFIFKFEGTKEEWEAKNIEFDVSYYMNVYVYDKDGNRILFLDY